MSHEDYDGQDIVVPDAEVSEVETETQEELVPVISKELESVTLTSSPDPMKETFETSDVIDQGESELEETLIIKESLESYYNLLKDSGLTPIKKETVQFIKVGLESIDSHFDSEPINDLIDSDSELVLKDNVALEEGFKSKLTTLKKRIVALIDWLIEKTLEIYTKYAYGLKSLSSTLKSTEKKLDKCKDTGKEIKIGVNQPHLLAVGNDFKHDPTILAGLVEFAVKDYPKALEIKINKTKDAIKNISVTDDDLLAKAEELKETLGEVPMGQEAFSKVNLFPGNKALVLNQDGSGFTMMLDDTVPVLEKHEYDLPKVSDMKIRVNVFKKMISDLETLSTVNVKLNRQLKDIQKSLNKLLDDIEKNKELNETEKTKAASDIVKWMTSLKSNTPTMKSVLTYIATTLRYYIATLDHEISRNLKAQED